MIRTILFALASLALLPAMLAAQDYPARTSPYVNDLADLLSPAQETALSLELAGLHFDDGVELTVLTAGSRHDYGDWETIEDFAFDLFAHWNLGATTGEDGILVLVLWDDQEMRIELGDAYGSDYNATAGDVIDVSYLPWFYEDMPGEAIVQGVAATIERIALAETPDMPVFEPEFDAVPDVIDPMPEPGQTGRRRITGDA